ncbi:Retrotransposon gag protein [Cordyceps fumosorosea ARSEF 2679]|uniref:Retrotransposon gag protein n=1 Tax=Cordyceps fumosorosea (strain ARSEF 2679) TaxID=1081104 RepID=A0A166VNG9_CORFA|nr:Retrotransposon gag protein [Cordyceps fumosorosea ARSEF 2679]OAA33858.1 Retrotransposon gag protein [Cordyceps fumosorosea ARSEF 2679]
MSNDVNFTGKAVELEHLLTHATVYFLSKPSKFTLEKTKTGFVASKFRGKALDWLTSKLKDTPTFLDEWEPFEDTLRDTFLPSQDTQKQSADLALRSLRQKGSAQQYALEFDKLMVALNYDTASRMVAFRAGLKPEVKKQLVGDSSTTYEELRSTAISYDEELFSLRSQQRRRRGKGPASTNKNTN